MRSFLPARESDPACLRHAPGAAGARVRLVVIPHAGGSASMFRHWAAALPPEVALVAVQPPGRETRSHEDAGSDLTARVGEIGSALATLPPLPVVLFGHSLGASIAFETGRRLDAAGSPPAHLIVSGARAPQDASGRPPISHLPDIEFLAALIALGGVPGELLPYTDYLAAILPMLRADIAMAETYHSDAEDPLDCPITVFGSDDDVLAPPQSQTGWSAQSTAPVRRILFPGDHFFVVHHRERVLAAVSDVLRSVLSAPAGTGERAS